jgi:hypothetical protein
MDAMGDPMTSLVIRPPKNQYPENTGTTLTETFGGVIAQISNIVVVNGKGEQLKCCFVAPIPVEPAEGE